MNIAASNVIHTLIVQVTVIIHVLLNVLQRVMDMEHVAVIPHIVLVIIIIKDVLNVVHMVLVLVTIVSVVVALAIAAGSFFIFYDFDDDDSAVIALIENLQRESLSFLEEAEAYYCSRHRKARAHNNS